MKTQFILCALFHILNVNIVQGQYQSVFGTIQTEWNFIALLCDGGFVDTYFHEKDTTINNIEYKIINNNGLLRESDSNSKLWYREFTNENEILIMDLELNSGDTFLINSFEFFVDTVYFENNLKVIEFNYMSPFHCGYYDRLKFREGEGPNHNFPFFLSANDDDVRLLRCYTKDSITINYLEGFGFEKDCRKSLVNTENIKEETFQIYPNPFDDYLTIAFYDNRFKSIELFNTNGLRLYNTISQKLIVDIKTESLPNGIYLLRILESDILKFFKFVKNK